MWAMPEERLRGDAPTEGEWERVGSCAAGWSVVYWRRDGGAAAGALPLQSRTKMYGAGRSVVVEPSAGKFANGEDGDAAGSRCIRAVKNDGPS